MQPVYILLRGNFMGCINFFFCFQQLDNVPKNIIPILYTVGNIVIFSDCINLSIKTMVHCLELPLHNKIIKNKNKTLHNSRTH